MRSIIWTCAGKHKDASEWIDIQPIRLSRIKEQNQFSLEKLKNKISFLFKNRRAKSVFFRRRGQP